MEQHVIEQVRRAAADPAVLEATLRQVEVQQARAGASLREAYEDAAICGRASRYVIDRARRLSVGVDAYLAYADRYSGRLESRFRRLLADFSERYERADGVDAFGATRRLRRLDTPGSPRRPTTPPVRKKKPSSIRRTWTLRTSTRKTRRTKMRAKVCPKQPMRRSRRCVSGRCSRWTS